jgi:hypothetical protein
VGDSRRDELESTGGDAVAEIEARATDAEIRMRAANEWREPAYHAWLELPLGISKEAAERIMSAVAAMWQETGHPTAWAVHRTNEAGAAQVHGHFVSVATFTATGEWRRPVEGGAEMEAFREKIAAIVNIETRRDGLDEAEWVGGGFKSLGSDRVPRERLPMALYKARQDRQAGRPLSKSRHRLAEAANRIDEAWERRASPEGQEKARSEAKEAAIAAASALSGPALTEAGLVTRRAMEARLAGAEERANAAQQRAEAAEQKAADAERRAARAEQEARHALKMAAEGDARVKELTGRRLPNAVPQPNLPDQEALPPARTATAGEASPADHRSAPLRISPHASEDERRRTVAGMDDITLVATRAATKAALDKVQRELRRQQRDGGGREPETLQMEMEYRTAAVTLAVEAKQRGLSGGPGGSTWPARGRDDQDVS